MGLDELMPRWDRRERHRIGVDLPADVVLRAAQETVWGDVPAFRAVMVVAGLGRQPFPRGQRIIELFTGNGFAVLHRGDSEIVVGGVERLSRRQPVVALGDDPAEWFRTFAEPGHLKVAFNFSYRDGLLGTETRVLGTDARARRLFAVYWAVIRAGSGAIRRVWLRGVRRRAGKLAAGTAR